MRDGEAVRKRFGRPGQVQGGTAAGFVGDLDLHPFHTAPPAGAEGLEGRLLGGKACGKALPLVCLAFAIGDLLRGEYPFEKAAAKTFGGLLNPVWFGNVNSGSDNHNQCSAPGDVKEARG